MAPTAARSPLWTHIACFVDESDASATALREAARLRAAEACRLSVVHVAVGPPHDVPPPPPAWLEGAATEAGGHAVLLVNLGQAAAAAGAWAEGARTDLIVASAHRGVRERIMLGSFAGYLARHAPCPVLLVRPR
jgi:nucleotide-binding universal stress UspA family protein